MGFSIGSVVGKITGGVKKASSVFGSGLKKVSAKVKSGINIVGTNIKNSVSKESINAFIQGCASGGLVNGILQAGANTAAMSMAELDKSGEYNPDYAYKQYGFPNKKEFDEACSYGVTDYSQWKAYKEQLAILGSEPNQFTVDSNLLFKGTGTAVPQNVSSGVIFSNDEPEKKGGIGGIIALAGIAKVAGLI